LKVVLFVVLAAKMKQKRAGRRGEEGGGGRILFKKAESESEAKAKEVNRICRTNCLLVLIKNMDIEA
jgi:hypothetical protein